MSNILVAKNYTVRDHTKWHDNKSRQATTIKSEYDEMEVLMRESAERYIADLDEIVVHTGEADNIRNVFKIHFKEIYDLWKQGHNILYCDLDVLFINPVEYFGKYNNFTMFNLTDPPKTSDAHYGIEFNWFFNCGIRYYPENMDQHVWDLGFSMLENWNPDRWDCEQIVYNAMMFEQSADPSDYYQPTHAFQMLTYPADNPANERFNQIPLWQAKAVHLHGSRNSGQRLEIMKQLNSRCDDDKTILLL